jgi:hypothetical protein
MPADAAVVGTSKSDKRVQEKAEKARRALLKTNLIGPENHGDGESTPRLLDRRCPLCHPRARRRHKLEHQILA